MTKGVQRGLPRGRLWFAMGEAGEGSSLLGWLELTEKVQIINHENNQQFCQTQKCDIG